VHNTQYTNITGLGGSYPGFEFEGVVSAVTTVIQGENLKFPKFSGTGPSRNYTYTDNNGTLQQEGWNNSGDKIHVGWAFRLSGVTSGGLVGGEFGGGIQPI